MKYRFHAKGEGHVDIGAAWTTDSPGPYAKDCLDEPYIDDDVTMYPIPQDWVDHPDSWGDEAEDRLRERGIEEYWVLSFVSSSDDHAYMFQDQCSDSAYWEEGRFYDDYDHPRNSPPVWAELIPETAEEQEFLRHLQRPTGRPAWVQGTDPRNMDVSGKKRAKKTRKKRARSLNPKSLAKKLTEH